MKQIIWKRKEGRVYLSFDNKLMIKNVGYKCWGLFVNDGSTNWDLNWVGSTYPSLKSAQNACAHFNGGN